MLLMAAFVIFFISECDIFYTPTDEGSLVINFSRCRILVEIDHIYHIPLWSNPIQICCVRPYFLFSFEELSYKWLWSICYMMDNMFEIHWGSYQQVIYSCTNCIWYLTDWLRSLGYKLWPTVITSILIIFSIDDLRCSDFVESFETVLLLTFWVVIFLISLLYIKAKWTNHI